MSMSRLQNALYDLNIDEAKLQQVAARGTAAPSVADVAAAPTQAEFNALLAALREVGVLSAS